MNDYAACLVLVSKNHPGPVPAPEDLVKPGVVSVTVSVPAGGVYALLADPMVPAYLREGLPVAAYFERADEALYAHAKLGGELAGRA